MSRERYFQRFTLAQRVEHLFQLVSFTVLAITGLPQKYPTSPISNAIIAFFGGIELTRLIHRGAAIVLMVATVYHFVVLAYKLYVQRVRPTMLPALKDATDAWQTFLFNLNLARHRPQMGRYTFEEKAEYWAFVWGTVVMVLTGFILWNPIATASLLPGQVIPAAKAAHGGEALLAVLAIIVWHFYGVHLRHFNRSMWTGQLSETEMRHEHPLELADLKAGLAERPVPAAELEARRKRFVPAAGVTSALLLVGVVWFVSFEQTSITTLPARPTVAAFAPQTPTPIPPTPTPPPIEALTWDGYFGTLFAIKCTACHGTAGGLSLEDYAAVQRGGGSGRALTSTGTLLAVQSAGGHPGELSPEELDRLAQWLAAGAPEN